MCWEKNRFEEIISYICLAALEYVCLDSAVWNVKRYKISMLCIRWVIPCLSASLKNTNVFWEFLPSFRCDSGGIHQVPVPCSRLYGSTSTKIQNYFLGEKQMHSVWTNERPYNQGKIN